MPRNPGWPVSCIPMPGQSYPDTIEGELTRTLHCWRAGGHGTTWETEAWKAETGVAPFKGLLLCQG